MQELLQKAAVFYFHDSVPSLDAVRTWVTSVWRNKQRLRVVNTRFLEGRIFVTIFETQEDRDAALATTFPTIRGNTCILLPWTPKVEQPNYTPTVLPTWIELPGFPSWQSSFFQRWVSRLGPILKIPPTSCQLQYNSARACILWDTTKPQPQHITLKSGDRVYQQRILASLTESQPAIGRFATWNIDGLADLHRKYKLRSFI
ncbi:hypothetical protein R1flu_008291 [Riccia fluitans]|uniref:DUF4283 domain-containing protein n=1 Tax=Riccia fluitans TaxID=41844 RepID=A0ABD1YBL8_9MARC